MILRPNLASRLTVALVIALLPSVTYPAQSANQNIRVLVTKTARILPISISATGGMLSVSTPQSTVTSTNAELCVEGSQIVCKLADGKSTAGQSVTIQAVDQKASLRLRSAAKREICLKGSIEARLDGTGLKLVNELPLEDYVIGVMPAEMPESFPPETLKAQAVAIRTYALRNSSKHKASGCDVCDDSRCCEEYAGVVDSAAKCAKAVQDTAGMILTYDGEPAHVFYSSDAGGSTQNYADSYPGRSIPYLRGVKDPEGVPHTTWERSFTLAELAGLLMRAGIKEAEGLSAIRIAEVAATGRVLAMEVTGAAGAKSIYAGQFRKAVGLEQVRSTLFTLDASDQGIVTFRGKGYGHGIGLCQLGAKGLAQAPFNYTWEQILAHYFPGTSVTSGSTTRLAQAPPAPKPAAMPTPRPTAAAKAKASPPKAANKAGKPTVVKQPADRLTFDVRLIDPDLP